MEWMLQVADEIDDVIGALRQCSLGLAAEIGLVAPGGFGTATPYAPGAGGRGEPPLL